MDYGFKLIYRKIRHQLTYAERRLFKLMYFRHAIFDYHVAAMTPVIWGFIGGMDKETQVLAFLVLVFKCYEHGGWTHLDQELERRWRAYLQFYPYWVAMIQDEDRHAKRDKHNAAISLDARVGGDEGRHLSLKDTIADVSSKPSDLFQLVAGSQGKLVAWATKYCTPKQARHVTSVAAGETRTAIAEREGISQPAVTKSVRTALRRIREGLRRDGLIEWDRGE